jgi:serine/threonine protein kinase
MKQIIKEKNITDREEKIKDVAKQLKNALHELHTKNIIHRDLKPDNILFNIENEKMVLKLADFGFSRLYDIDQIDAFGNAPLIRTICGTPIYMAPELLLKETYNIKADLWSVGVILYEMMYGFVPFYNATTIKELRNCASKNEIQFGQKIKYSDELIDLVKRLLIADSTKRINFIDFFNHDWFNESVFYSMDDYDDVPLQMIDYPQLQESEKPQEILESTPETMRPNPDNNSNSNLLIKRDVDEIIMISSMQTIDLRDYYNETKLKKFLNLLKKKGTYVYNITNEQYMRMMYNQVKITELDDGWTLMDN